MDEFEVFKKLYMAADMLNGVVNEKGIKATDLKDKVREIAAGLKETANQIGPQRSTVSNFSAEPYQGI